MVAYSFKKRFANDIAHGRKRQTIRAHGKRRHARPGEPVQLYTGMRTKQCRKLLKTDPICKAVTDIRIRVPHSMEPCQITFKGETRYVDHDFARADGFDSPEDFTRFWFDTHGPGYFEGVVIEWDLQAKEAPCRT